MRALKPKVKKEFEKYAEILGYEDCGPTKDGREVRLGRNKDAIQKKHLFYIKNTELENAAGALVLGNVIPELINDEVYEIKYIGVLPIKKGSKEEKVLNDVNARIDRDVKAGEVAKKERLGIYDSEESETKE